MGRIIAHRAVGYGAAGDGPPSQALLLAPVPLADRRAGRGVDRRGGGPAGGDRAGESCPPVGAPRPSNARSTRERPGSCGASAMTAGSCTATTRRRDAVSSAYNSTRHAGVMDALYRLGRIRAAPTPGCATSARNLVRHDDWAAFAPGRRGRERRRERARRRGPDAPPAGDARRALRRPRPAARPVPARHRSATTGASSSTGGPPRGAASRASSGSSRPARRSTPSPSCAPRSPRRAGRSPRTASAGYLATRRDRREGYTVRQADHWAAYGLEALAPAGLTDVEAGYARFLAGYFGFLVRLDSQRTAGRSTRSRSRARRSGRWARATGALRRLAGEDARLADLRDELGERNACLTGILVDRQVGPESPNPRARGAWFADGYTQMDDQQHAVAALLGSGQAADDASPSWPSRSSRRPTPGASRSPARRGPPDRGDGRALALLAGAG